MDNKQLTDSDTSEEEQVNPMLKTSEEERHYRTTCGSAVATQIISHSMAQAKLSEEDLNVREESKKLPEDKANDKLMQTSKGGKQNN